LILEISKLQDRMASMPFSSKNIGLLFGEVLIDEVLLAINSRVIPAGWNNTTIVLIPKVDSPEKVTQFRPISLCNVLYKVISKVIAKRLKTILPEVISSNQSVFVPGCLITDNFLVAYKSYHTIKNKKIGKYGMCAIKLDMHNAVLNGLFFRRL
jgi:hypothetical protein